jgi:predicted membrane protein
MPVWRGIHQLALTSDRYFTFITIIKLVLLHPRRMFIYFQIFATFQKIAFCRAPYFVMTQGQG